MSAISTLSISPPILREALATQAGADPAHALTTLVDHGFDRLPLPGLGQTLVRWRMLAAVGAHDLGLAKFFEGHTDALAVLAELGAPRPAPGSVWATWAAEPPDARLRVARRPDGRVVLDGDKAWCSGAHHVSHALVTAWDEDGRQQLVAVEIRQPGIAHHGDGWRAVGMGATQSIRLVFRDVVGDPVGGPGDYTVRPGFWHGGAGVAACWLGAAQWLGDFLRRHCHEGAGPQRLAHLGHVHVALQGAANTLHALAAQIDAVPTAPHQTAVQHARLLVEAACDTVMRHVGRALGATPFCADRQFAQLMADLPVFLRQSHAERDLAALGESIAMSERAPWVL